MLHDPYGNLRPRADSQLVQDVHDVGGDSAFGDYQRLRDPLVGVPAGDKACHVSFALSQARLFGEMDAGSGLCRPHRQAAHNFGSHGKCLGTGKLDGARFLLWIRPQRGAGRG